MVLATADAAGSPSARTVLLKGYDGRGLRFFTNLGSAKAAELAANPRAAVVFPWHPVARQVRVAGAVVAVDRGEVEEYFASRPRDSQLGAWASAQSTVVPSRAALDAALADVAARFPAEVPAPPGWGGYRVVPDSWEFWAGRVGRLHDRLRYRRTDPSGGWTVERLAP
jgi:pyridoxamine 5'-phosphate oxidase